MICLPQWTSEWVTQHPRWLTSGGCVSHFVRETGRQLLRAYLCYVNTIYIPCTLRAVWPSATHAAWASALQSASQMEMGPAPCALPPSYTQACRDLRMEFLRLSCLLASYHHNNKSHRLYSSCLTIPLSCTCGEMPRCY